MDICILGTCRTPIGSFGGSLKDTGTAELGRIVIENALKRSGVKPEWVDEVVMGCTLQAGLGQNVARQSAVKAGIPVTVPATTVNQVCGSGLYSIITAYRMIASGEADCVVCGGMENMSMSPYVLGKARWGIRMGDSEVVDVMISDGLTDAFSLKHMGITAENVASRFNITRDEQDDFTVLSQQKAAKARADGMTDDEIVAVKLTDRKGNVTVFDKDEYIREGVTKEGLAKLRPAFVRENGTVTAGNSSGINDGAAAMVVCSDKFIKEHALTPELKIISVAVTGVEPDIMGYAPVSAVNKVCEKAGVDKNSVDLFELNEAFAAQASAVVRDLGIDKDKVNIFGGAVALGHPIGSTGARIVVTLANALKKTGKKTGVASLCVGGGMADAILVERY